MLQKIKKILRKNSLAVWLYYHSKKIIIYPLRFTSLRILLEDSHPTIHSRKPTTFPLRALFNPRKLSVLKVVAPYTLLGYSALGNAYDLAEDVENRNLSGAFVECGTWKGGVAALMASV